MLAPNGSIGCESLNGAPQFGQPVFSPQLSQYSVPKLLYSYKFAPSTSSTKHNL